MAGGAQFGDERVGIYGISLKEDMAKFVSLQFRQDKVGGSQILSTAALRLMHRVRVLDNNWQAGNAIGFAVIRDGEKIYVGHGGSYFDYKTQTFMQEIVEGGHAMGANLKERAKSEAIQYTYLTRKLMDQE